MSTSQASEEQHQPPIARLDEDILRLIFLENTEIYQEKRLATARYSSQVCRGWRHLMLDSSSIWGRLMDIDTLQATTSEWVREVMSRSKQAALWVTGVIGTFKPIRQPPRDPVNPDIFFTFISENWARIEILDVSNYSLETSRYLGVEQHDRAQYWHRLLSLPAPLLKEFSFRYRYHDSHAPENRPWQTQGPYQATGTHVWFLPLPLFNSAVPALRKIEVYTSKGSGMHKEFTMNMPLLWISKLRSLTLRQRLDLNQLLGLLRKTPLLEKLEVTRFAPFAQADPIQQQETPVSLPRLSSLGIQNTWRTIESHNDAEMFLQLIAASPGCCLSMSLLRKREDLPPQPQKESLERNHVVFMRYIHEYFEHHQVKKVFLSYNDHYLEIQEQASFASSTGRLPESYFSVWIPSSGDDSWILQSLLQSSPFFSYVKELDMRKWEKSIPYPPSAFYSVEIINLQCASLGSLLKFLEEGNDLMFPALRTLVLHGRNLDAEYATMLQDFLEQRREISRPISVLDLSHIERLSCNLDVLDEFGDLTVDFAVEKHLFLGPPTRKSYICGTGHPELLRFGDPRYYEPYRDWAGTVHCCKRRRNRYGYMYGWSGRI